MQEKDWPNGFTQLTAAGIEQSYRLGKYFRTRYGSLLNPEYNRSEIYVRSVDYDLSLMSAQSNLAALYPLPKKSESKVPFQPVPIHTVPITQDFVCYFQR
jgi:elongation factor P--beta-lysine ligase